jgi:hypothetical protein
VEGETIVSAIDQMTSPETVHTISKEVVRMITDLGEGEAVSESDLVLVIETTEALWICGSMLPEKNQVFNSLRKRELESLSR